MNGNDLAVLRDRVVQARTRFASIPETGVGGARRRQGVPRPAHACSSTRANAWR
jgi:hypothetical protein